MTPDNHFRKNSTGCIEILLVSFLYILTNTIFYLFYDGKELLKFPVILTYIIGLPLLVYILIQLYKAWKSIQILRDYDVLEKWKMPTPGKAIGFLFIPIFHLYWGFIAYSTLLSRANRLADEMQSTQPARFYPAIGFLYAACFVTSMIRGVSFEETNVYTDYVFAVADCVLFILTYWQIKKVIRTFSSYQSNPVASPPSLPEAI